MERQEAQQMAVRAIEKAQDGEATPVYGTVYVILQGSTYSVMDNGEEASGLSEEAAIAAIVEDLTN